MIEEICRIFRIAGGCTAPHPEAVAPRLVGEVDPIESWDFSSVNGHGDSTIRDLKDRRGVFRSQRESCDVRFNLFI